MGPSNVTRPGYHVFFICLFGNVQPHLDPYYFLYANDGCGGIFLSFFPKSFECCSILEIHYLSPSDH